MTILNPPTPGRPDHPDFKRLDDAVKTQDMRANLGRQLSQQLGCGSTSHRVGDRC